ncbi:alpha/beta fold hydrolase [Rubrivirga sp. S365]|uniref:Alpha/beta fold hydrolase n=1 Tax=Rubrivirga litoralis TaxID=3075598 RepID=A0ABU3BPF5_9BACT|nr:MULTISPECIES: dienelactone hydrolase family protein [unclassified Rubrivirga]MDT0631164.1 alpha/beta fold hydrolase [Rubrivirga sp. F394]MDT7856693.1 alpha/beta fold hydrolase [Rubrivirga sp. S365]
MTADPHTDAGVHTLVSADSPHTVLVLCHGRGATATSLEPLAQAVARPGVSVLAPQAGTIQGVPQWYPNSFLAPLADNEPALSGALAAVERAVEDARALGVGDAQIVLGGFSQGACLAAEYAARHARRWGGVVALSGALIGTAEADDASPRPELAGAGGAYPDKAFEYDGDLAGTSVFLGCAERDPHIPLARLERSATVLTDLGGDVTKRVYPGGTHAVVDDEVQFVRELLDYLAC